MITRRRLVGLGTVAALGATAGCLDAIVGDGPMEFDADPVAPTDDALAETGFEGGTLESMSIEEVIDLGGEREIRATMWLGAYTKEVDFEGYTAEAASFVAVSTPGLEVAGVERNPIVDADTEELIDAFDEEFGDELGSMNDVRLDDRYDLRVLGESRTVDVLLATSEHAGAKIEFRLEVTRFEHDGDVLVLAGGHPTAVSSTEVELDALMASVEHPATIE